MADKVTHDAEFTMHLSEFTRRDEIQAYAVSRRISFNEAVVQLVNHALSHRAHQQQQRESSCGCSELLVAGEHLTGCRYGE